MLSGLRRRAREASAVLKQGLLLRHDAWEPVLPSAEAGEHVVLFLHGLFASAGVLKPMRHRFLRHTRICTGALSYPPGPDVEALSARLEALATRLPSDVKLHIVGHSLGGIVARHYAVYARDPRLVSIVSLASPFGGVRGAARFGFAKDLDPASGALARLRGPCPVPHLVIVGADDSLTAETDRHTFAESETRVVPDVGHHTILFDEGVGLLVERFVLERADDAA